MGPASRAALLLAVTVFAIVGCGGSTKSASVSNSSAVTHPSTQTSTPPQTTPVRTAPLSRAELIAKADEICFGINAKVNSTKLGSLEEAARQMPILAAYKETAVVEMSRLVPPASMEAAWKQIVASARALAHDTAKLGEYARENRSREIPQVFAAAGKTNAQMTTVARRNGFKDCAAY